jgi:hypothetical protein
MDNQASAATTWRWPLFFLGIVLFLLGPAAVFVQFQMHIHTTPYYVPILATLGVALMGISLLQLGGVLRGVGLLLFLGVCGLEWYMLLVLMRTPEYAGPAVGQKIPAFATTLADGATFSNDDLAKGQRTVLVFYRGHW